MRLNTLIRRVERVRDDMVLYVKAACEKEKEAIVDLNRAQLERGENAEGVLMNGGAYSPTSVRQRAKLGLPIDHVYLSFEGDLQETMKVEFTETGFSVVTTDWKQQLVDEAMRTGYWPSSGYNAPHYGPVFGLDEVSRGLLMWRIRPRVAVSIRNRLLKG
jgi:hypothetical protein